MKVLFICHANVCRSYMAQEFLRQLRPELTVFSRGLYADPAYHIPHKVLEFLKSQQISPITHTPTQLSAADMIEADYVFFMEQAHLDTILDRYAQYTDKCYLLAEFAEGINKDIPDPIGLEGRNFIKAAADLQRIVTKCSNCL